MTTVPLTGIAHLGIRVHDLERSLAFYRVLGFELALGPIGSEPVAILAHPAGIELNLVLNAPDAAVPNVLMDVPVKAPGITHLALACADLTAAADALRAAGYAPRGEPVRFPTGAEALFVRDPDGVVIELHRPAAP